MIWRFHHHNLHDARLHNTAEGLVAFVVCAGPGFARIQADKLGGRGRVVIGVNSTYPALRPDYWVGMDTPDCYHGGLLTDPLPKVFRGTHGNVPVLGKSRTLKQVPGVLLAGLDAKVNYLSALTADGCFRWMGDTLTVAIQLAAHLGCKEIRLLGVDLDTSVVDYADPEQRLTAPQRQRNQDLYDLQMNRLAALQAEFAERGIKLESSSAGSRINALLPFEAVEAVLARLAAIPATRTKMHAAEGEPRIALVLRSGGEYKPEHVNRLAAMLPQRPLCLTDCDPTTIQADCVKLDYNWPGWWSKLELFRPDLHDGPLMFFDLDTTVRTWNPAWLRSHTSLMLSDFGIPTVAASGVMLIRPEDRDLVWRKWMLDPARWMRELRGDQDFIGQWLPARRWQDVFPGEFASYKLSPPELRDSVACLCYHGQPKPWTLTQPAT